MAAQPPPGWGNPIAPQPPAGWGNPMAQQQQQQQQPYPVQMGGGNVVSSVAPSQPAEPPAPTYPLLWPNGVGWTTRDLSDGKDPYSCRPFCGCCLLPFQFHDKDLVMHGELGSRSVACRGWTIENADLIGKRFNFELKAGPFCCSDQVDVLENGDLISKTVIKSPCNPSSWGCEVEDIVTVSDASGKERFARRDSVCCQKNFGRYSSNGTFGFRTLRHPFYPANSTVKLSLARATGFITYRHHVCQPCYLQFVGFDEVPNTLTPQEQKMILGLIMDPTISKAPVDNNQ